MTPPVQAAAQSKLSLEETRVRAQSLQHSRLRPPQNYEYRKHMTNLTTALLLAKQTCAVDIGSVLQYVRGTQMRQAVLCLLSSDSILVPGASINSHKIWECS